MTDLIAQAQKTPKALTDEELANVFVRLMEYPTDEGLTHSDLVDTLVNRAASGSYEILRALSLYYSNLNGDLFYVGVDMDYERKYLRALEYIGNALKVRDKSYDDRLIRYGEYEDSYLERDLAFALRSLFGRAEDIQESLEYDLGKEHKLSAESVEYSNISMKAEELSSPLDVLHHLQPHHEKYTSFVVNYIATCESNDCR